MKNSMIPPRICLRIKILLLLGLSLSFSVQGQDEILMAVPAPKGILIFTGMELANGKRIDSYSIERSYDKRQWEMLAELKSPAEWDVFHAGIKKWKPDFGFQGLPETNDLRDYWEKCETAGAIDSMAYWASATTIRLAAGIAFYDQTAQKEKRVWYRVRALKNGNSVTENISLPAQYPFVPQYDPVLWNEKNVDKNLFYLKWLSTGSNPAPYFGIRFYEDGVLKQAEGTFARYNISGTTYYIFQDSTLYVKSDRQYFLNPLDMYGNQGVATDIVSVSKSSVNQPFFHKTQASTDPKGFGIVLSWQLQHTDLLKGLKIYKSDAFDGKEYELAATIPCADITYTDRKIDPDKMYYYYLETVSAQNELPQKSNIFFDAAYDKLKPVHPAISRGEDVKNGVTIFVNTTEINVVGVKIYRSDGITADLYPITDLLKPTGNEVSYTDTSQILSGGRSFLYAATVVNSSSVESAFSDTITVHPKIPTTPPSPNSLSVFEEDHAIHLVWEDVKTRHRATKGYNVYVRELPNGSFAPLLQKDSLVLVPVFTDHTAQAGRMYEYAVQTVDDLGGKSETMVLASVSVKPFILPVPPNVWLLLDGGKVTVQWAETSVKEPLNVTLYRYQRGSAPQRLKVFQKNEERKFEDASVKNGELYFYFTTFKDNQENESGRSQEVGIRVK